MLPASPVLAVTCGDPAGIGPEICLQLLEVYGQPEQSRIEPCVPIVFGDRSVFERLLATDSGSRWAPVWQALPVLCWDEFVTRTSPPTAPLLVDMQQLHSAEICPGQVTAAQGAAAYCYIERAIQQALSGKVQGIVTGPIHKEALHAAGIPYPGHTEILTEKTGTASSVMMLTSPEITCSLVTAHVGYHEVPALLTCERVLETILLTAEAMKRMRGRAPRLTMCGLNPHAGEHGLFGRREEERILIPALQQAQAQGIDISGPFPPDTAFLPARRKLTDAYICMYHDQGLIPLKALAFDEAVNVTLGLPIVRTSVDHGTAFDIAWQGKADVNSLIQAVNLACRLAASADEIPAVSPHA